MKSRDSALEQSIRQVRAALAGLRFGTIEIVVHDGKVAYIERRERTRISNSAQPDSDHRPRSNTTPPGERSSCG
jgi:hypothetical protein